MLITITNSGKPNGRPTQIGAKTLSLAHAIGHVFTIANFTTETTPPYSDPEGDALKYIQVTSLSLLNGSIKLNGIAVVTGQLIDSGHISSGNLIYSAPTSEVNTAYVDGFTFDVADVGSNSLSGLSTGVFSLSIAAKVNQPASSVGDNTLTTANATTYTFTSADFTTSTTPAYADPEGDAAAQLKILSLPSAGYLRYNNINVTINQVIAFTQITSGYLQYVPDASVITLQSLTFDFSIADAGSGIFVEN